MGDDERRAVGVGLGLIERLADLIEVVTVDLDHRPAERLPLLDHRLEVEDLRHEVVELDAVCVEDHRQVTEAVPGLTELRSFHARLPDLTLLDLAVTEDAVHAIGFRAEAKAEPHSDRDREALAERAGGRLDAGRRLSAGLPLEWTAEL